MYENKSHLDKSQMIQFLSWFIRKMLMIIDMFPSLWANKWEYLEFFAHSLQQSFLHGVKH